MTQRPKVFHGWKILGVTMLTQALVSGLYGYGFGVLQVPIATEFSVSRSAVSIAFSAAVILSGLLSPFTGLVLDRHDNRALMIWGAVAMTIAFVGMSLASALWLVLVLYAVGCAVGLQSLGNLPSSKLMASWFVRRRGRALGLTAMGTSFGGLLIPPLLAEGIAQLGWRGAVASIAIASGLLAVAPIAIWIRNAPRDLGVWPDGDPDPPPQLPRRDAEVWTARRLLRERSFWVLTLAMGSLMSINGSLIANLPPIGLELGMSPRAAAGLLSLLSLAGLAGKLVFGFAAERIDKRLLMAVAMAALLGFMELLSRDPSARALQLGTLMPGLSLGGVLPLWGALLADHYGTGSLGRAMGLMLPATIAFQIAGLQFLPWCFDTYGSYAPAFRVFQAVILVGLCAVALAKPPGGRRAGAARHLTGGSPG